MAGQTASRSPAVLSSGSVRAEELVARVRRLTQPSALETPSWAPLEIDLSRNDHLLDGWWAPELLTGALCRPTMRRFGFELDVRPREYVAIDGILFPQSGLAELRARLRAGETAGAAFRFLPGANSFLLKVPPGVAGLVRFWVDLDGSWHPAASGESADDRELGIYVTRLALVKAPAVDRIGSMAALPPADGQLAPISPQGGLIGLARRLRRLLLGWEISDRLDRVRGLETALAAAERRIEELSARLGKVAAAHDAGAEQIERRMEQLASEIQEIAADGEELGEELRDDLARRLLAPSTSGA